MNNLKKFEYTPILGWSISRYGKFSLCKRQYFYDYYSKYDKTYSKEKIDTLKRLTSKPLEIGNIVHDILEVLLKRLLKSETEINKNKLQTYTKKKTNEYCNSKEFSEVYYNETEKINEEDILENVNLSLNNFLNSERFNWLTKKVINNKKNWIIEPPGFGETRINGKKAYCKVDFLFPMENKIYILDWKTGKSDEKKHKKQLIGYSSWASFHFDKNPDHIIPVISYLKPEYRELEIKSDEYNIDDFFKLVEKETEEMYGYCLDIKKNIPKDKENFLLTENKKLCSFCNFRELCF